MQNTTVAKLENKAIAKPLHIANKNNKFQCKAFIEIHFEPPPESIREEHFNKIYVIKDEDKTIFVKLVDFARQSFGQMSTVATMAAYALEAEDWKLEWLKTHPGTTPQTVMGIYIYEVLN